MASKPCDQLDAQPWGAKDLTSEEGTSGLGMGLGYALQVVDPQALTETAPDRSGSRLRRSWRRRKPPKTPEGSEMDSQVPTTIHGPPSEYAEVRAWRVARRRHPAVLQRERSIAQRPGHHFKTRLAVIFGQRVVDKVRASIAVDTQKTSKRRRETAATWHREFWTSLARSHEHLADCSARPPS